MDREQRVDPRRPGGDPFTPRDRHPVDVAYAEDHGSPGIGESRDPDQLQDEIELLQNRMAERLDRVSSAFTPQNLIAQATGERNPDLFTTFDTVVDAARRNPMAAALIGAGLAQLVFANRPSRRYAPDPAALEAERATYGVEGVTADGRRFAAGGALDDADHHLHRDDDPAARDPLLDGEERDIDEVESRVRRLQDRAAARLSAATHAMSRVYDEGRLRMRTGMDRARHAFSSDDDPYVERPGPMDWVRENPVPIGLAALAAGALAAGYYTASRPEPRTRPLPHDRSLVPLDDDLDVMDAYEARMARDDEPPMPVSAAAPAPMGAAMTRTAAVGGSGQMAGGEPRQGTATGLSDPTRVDASAGASQERASLASAGAPGAGNIRSFPGSAREESRGQVAEDGRDDPSDSTVELTRVYPRG